uniref:Uncharacterized protein n=1 Tax=Brassica oleracea var. oleracea TaxID=109376 RepID=A0A0D3AZ32_BRAOL
MSNVTIINEKALNECLKEITCALSIRMSLSLS